MTVTETEKEAVEVAALCALAYFGVFAHPLTTAEVLAFCSEPRATQDAINRALQGLVEAGRAYCFDGYYQMSNSVMWLQERQARNARADASLPIARRMARLIGQFPFVRGVFVSGSLSKHSMGPDSDIDFFIVTAPGRLWLARTLLVFFKKVFLLNSHKYFCINYFVDTNHLEIEEKNKFTATEAVTLLPLWGKETYQLFCQANTWAWQQYPHISQRPLTGVPEHRRGLLKAFLEKIFSTRIGDWLEAKAMRLTVGFWKRKFRDLDEDTFDLALKSRQGVSKHHPQHFQRSVLARFEENYRTLTASALVVQML